MGDLQASFRKMLDKRLLDMYGASASCGSVYGKVASRQKKKENKTVFEITVPASCTADIILPVGRAETEGEV
ncbi:MAG: hypothetical protein IJJ00_04675 [Erysipelotrichaceae bacterium]|nr:hypothetical protein [Erysipelotrichaceae bacterium]